MGANGHCDEECREPPFGCVCGNNCGCCDCMGTEHQVLQANEAILRNQVAKLSKDKLRFAKALGAANDRNDYLAKLVYARNEQLARLRGQNARLEEEARTDTGRVSNHKAIVEDLKKRLSAATRSGRRFVRTVADHRLKEYLRSMKRMRVLGTVRRLDLINRYYHGSTKDGTVWMKPAVRIVDLDIRNCARLPHVHCSPEDCEK